MWFRRVENVEVIYIHYRKMYDMYTNVYYLSTKRILSFKCMFERLNSCNGNGHEAI